MTFNNRGHKGGHTTIGATAPSRKWYLAEGCTIGDFETQVLIYNPSRLSSKVNIGFTKTDGSKVTKGFWVRGHGRRTIIADNIPSLRSTGFATRVEVASGPAVVVERSMYFGYGAINGGHNTMGAPAPEKQWFFAEGTTKGPFETWILVQNAGRKEAAIKATFVRPDGTTLIRRYKLSPGRRRTISVDSLPGLKATDVSAKIESTNGVRIVAERSMYFNYPGRSGGHVTLGASHAADTWYLADGFTGDDYETWILLYNPRSHAIKVNARFTLRDGRSVVKKIIVSPHSRRTISVDSLPSLQSARVSAKIFSTNGAPFVVEKAVYFNDKGRSGGNVTIGYTP
jgi:hypothetical protein